MNECINSSSLTISSEQLSLCKVFSAQSSFLLNTLACLCTLIVERVSTEVASHILLSSKRNRISYINTSAIIQTMQERTDCIFIELSHRLSIILHSTLQASKLSSSLLNEILSTLSSIFYLSQLSLIVSITDSNSRVISRLSISNRLLLCIFCRLLFHKSLTLHGHVASLVECLLCISHISRYDTICILTKLRVIQLSSLCGSQLREVRIAILQHWHDGSIFESHGRSLFRSRSILLSSSILTTLHSTINRERSIAIDCHIIRNWWEFVLHLYLTSIHSTIILYH